jgi:hypothetical protein
VLRGKATFTQTFRVMGFVQVVHLLELFRLIRPIEPLATLFVTLLSIFAAWLAMAEAHRFRGWRTLTFPLLYFAILTIGGLALLSLFGGFDFALETLAQRFGWMP